ncbi:glycosyltransferase [Photobacterium sp. WH24]|uniref:glycosyltransferase n=1 Tax=Photobacterium sp. WH24 TaxID=2827237 RepID=UPI001C481F23|nr:glycosyltransferase [Photobacterium sp. WH24]MBV7260585.1 glycosyltransferase [Photobacterium sp. WH24]
MPLVSVVIRTLNEERHLEELLNSISNQKSDLFDIEIVVVDSGSTDKTLDIAKAYKARITYIKKSEFTFGRSLNIGCEFAQGDYLAFVSGHCIPANDNWIHELVLPLYEGVVSYTYGRQLGRDTTKFSEQQLFDKYFPAKSKIPQVGFFCNNANSAIRKDIWNKFKFDETLTGLEDMYLAKQLVDENERIGYVSGAAVYHIHDETWSQVKIRYEREAIALQKILPELHFSIKDLFSFIFVAVLKDCKEAFKRGILSSELTSIIRFRFAQYYGAYCGNHIHRQLSHEMKIKYFYPRITSMDVTHEKKENRSFASNESKQ